MIGPVYALMPHLSKILTNILKHRVDVFSHLREEDIRDRVDVSGKRKNNINELVEIIQSRPVLCESRKTI